MPIAGYKALLKTSGSPVAFTDEATTTSNNQSYQITDAAKRTIGPEENVTVEVGGVATTENYEINRLTGTIIFDTVDSGRGAVTVTSSYLPLSTVTEAHEFSYTLEADNQDADRFNSEWKRRKQALKDLSCELSQWHETNYTLFNTALQDETVLVLEFSLNGQVDFRAWVRVASDEVSGSADALVEESIEFEGTTDKEGRTLI